MVGCAGDGGDNEDNAAAGDQDGDDGDGDGDDGNDDGNEDLTDGLDDSDKTGNIRTYLTDAPGDFDEVWVTISAVEIHGYHGTYSYDGADGGVAGDGGVEADSGPEGYAEPEASWETLVDETQTLDLLTLQNDVTAVLGDAEVEPGEYSQLRLIVDSASVVVGEEEEDLTIPSGTQTGIKINLDFEVLPETEYVIVLDFDAAESVKETGQGHLMQPMIKIEYIGYYDSEGALVEARRHRSLDRRRRRAGRRGE